MVFDRVDSAAVIRRALALLGQGPERAPEGMTARHEREVSVMRALRPDLSRRQAEALLRGDHDGVLLPRL